MQLEDIYPPFRKAIALLCAYNKLGFKTEDIFYYTEKHKFESGEEELAFFVELKPTGPIIIGRPTDDPSYSVLCGPAIRRGSLRYSAEETIKEWNKLVRYIPEMDPELIHVIWTSSDVSKEKDRLIREIQEKGIFIPAHRIII